MRYCSQHIQYVSTICALFEWSPDLQRVFCPPKISENPKRFCRKPETLLSFILLVEMIYATDTRILLFSFMVSEGCMPQARHFPITKSSRSCSLFFTAFFVLFMSLPLCFISNTSSIVMKAATEFQIDVPLKHEWYIDRSLGKLDSVQCTIFCT